MTVNTIDPTKPILGYALRQRIGVGGFGEVWAAEAPGGLPKAVKFIFGFHDERRAQAELKALNRIREVRHPFLLSLERIDIVDGQMVVITELADMCLKSRCEQCLESGLPGIPRAELLGYLRDAAGALDYISHEFRLQHLDIKPENLLLVSGHVKVADFGLVKDIHDGTQSMMSGLTPAYAPPELFDGRPSKFSDQYSLAILYQELLTGQRPFAGTTAAQLASQHINDRPDLKPLPREDQATISRALSKDPEMRYPSCAELIEQLASGRSKQVAAGAKPRTRSKLRDARRKRSTTARSSTFTLSGTRESPLSPKEVMRLEPIEFDRQQAKFRPTLFIGLGKTGTLALRQLRQKIHERDGELEALPAIRLLAVDTDQQDLMQPDKGSFGKLSPCETFAMPLRSPAEYRVDGKVHLSWLSRRWIYNVPKTLRTEGIRPLGRLAFATHCEDFAIRLRQTLSELIQTESVTQTAGELELDPVMHPRIVLLGAVGGGTCSGMAIDVAYVVRGVLRELGVLEEDLVGVFTHSVHGLGKQRELVIANALVFLNELYHFSCVEEFPGDAACSIAPSTDGTTTFASTYLSPLGDDLSTEDWTQAVDRLAEYLYLTAATPCGTYFDQCRRQEQETQGLPLRTLGLSRAAGGGGLRALHAGQLRTQVLTSWQAASSNFDAEARAREVLHELTATSEQMVRFVHEAMQHVLGDPVMSLAGPVMEQFQPDDPAGNVRRFADHGRSLLGRLPGEPQAVETKLQAAIAALQQHFLQDRFPEVRARVLQVLETPGARLAGARALVHSLTVALQSQGMQLEAAMERGEEQFHERLRTWNQAEAGESQAAESIHRLAESWLQHHSLQSVREITRAFQDLLPSLETDLAQVERCLEDVVSGLPAPTTAPDMSPSPFAGRVGQRLGERLPQLAQRVEQQLQHNFLEQHGGLLAVLKDEGLRKQLADALGIASETTIREQLRELEPDEYLGAPEEAEQTVTQWFEHAFPSLLDCGGRMRLLCAVPRRCKSADQTMEKLREAAKQSPNMISATLGDVVVVGEAEAIPLENVAMRLIHGRPDSLEFASRLHTRTDISWTHISSMR